MTAAAPPSPPPLLAPAAAPPALAASMRPVAEALGLETALAIARHFGGMNLYLRKVPADNDPLLLLIGHRAAQLLVDRLGHGIFYVAQCQAPLLAERNAAIRQRYAAGEALNSLVSAYGLSRAQVLRILAEDPARVSERTSDRSPARPPAGQAATAARTPDLFDFDTWRT